MRKLLKNSCLLLAAIGLIIAVGCAVDDSNGDTGGSNGAAPVIAAESGASSSSASSAENPFGDTGGVSDPYLTAEVYDITVKNSNATTDNFSDNPIEGAAKLYSKSINVPIRAYTQGFPGVENKIEYFGVKYTGTITAPKSGTYTFLVVCDDGVSMNIGGTELSFTKLGVNKKLGVVDTYFQSAYDFCDDPALVPGFIENGSNWLYNKGDTDSLSDDSGLYCDKTYGSSINKQHAAGMYKATIELEAGQSYSFLLKYFQGPREHIACTLKVVIPDALSSELFSIDNFK